MAWPDTGSCFMSRDEKSSKKGKYISIKMETMENMGLLLNRAGELVTKE